MKKSIFIVSMFVALNSFSQNFVAENFEVSTSSQSTEVITPKVTVVSKLFYDLNESDLTEESIASVKTMLTILKENPTMKIAIASYRGSSEDFAILSTNRASKVKKYLVENGIKSNRLKIVNFENSKPISDGIDEQLDRRVEFIFD